MTMSEQTNELTINSSTMVEENFEIHHPQMVDTTLLFVRHSNLFKIHHSQMAETTLRFVNHGWRQFQNLLSSNDRSYIAIRQPWLGKILKFTIIKWLKLHFYSSTMV